MDDCFFRFWFRFVHKFDYLNELGRRDRMLELASRDFDVFSGYALERYFSAKLVEEKRCTRIGGWWDRKGENEIDIVCEDEVSGSLGPIIASGGAGKKEHFRDVFTEGHADAALAASVFHFGEIPVPELKQYLRQEGINVRI